MNFAAVAMVCVGLASSAVGQPVDTSFTYQGELVSAGSPVSSPVDLRFRLYDSAQAGTQIGPTLASNGLSPVAGRFSVSLDFGSNVYNGAKRWLEIEAAFAGGQSVILSPRQELKGTPYAQFALNIPASMTTFNNSSGNAVFTSGSVGVGISSPTAGLHVTRAGSSGLLLNVSDSLMVAASDGFVGVNRTVRQTGAEVFGLSNRPGLGGYVGMYIKSDSQSGLPFYGYTTPNAVGWSQMDDSGTWKLYLAGGERLAVTSGGLVSATSFSGAGSGLTGIPITNTTGAMPVNRGGTGATAAGPAGGVAFSNGSGLNFTAAGSASQFLRGGSTPGFSSLQAADLPAAAGDVTGSYALMRVSALQGIPLSLGTVTEGDVLRYQSGQLRPVSLPAETVQSSLGTVRIVAGFVETSTTSGPGFTVTRLGSGQYQINYSPIFAGEPVFTATPFNSTNSTAVVYGVGVAATWVRLYNSSGVPTDMQFMFTAIGRR